MPCWGLNWESNGSFSSFQLFRYRQILHWMHVITFEILVILETLNYKHIFILYSLTSCFPTPQNSQHAFIQIWAIQRCRPHLYENWSLNEVPGRKEPADRHRAIFCIDFHPCPLPDEWLHKSKLAVSLKTQSKTEKLSGCLKMKNIH